MNPYTVLGVEPTATPDEIKAAFRRKAKESHPDAGGKAEDFDQITRANDILSDPERRNRFDETGDTGEPSIDNPDAAAWHIIATLFESALQEPTDRTDGDLIAVMKGVIDRATGEINQQIAKIQREIDRAEKMRKRFRRKTKDDQPDMLANMLAHRAKRSAEILEQAKAEKRHSERAKEILDGYTYDRPFPQPGEYMQVRFQQTVSSQFFQT